MKFRVGFVSNSSSTSFIVDGTKYTCVEVAKDMINQLRKDEEWSHWTDERCDAIIKKLDALDDQNHGILIELSDDLEIGKKGDDILVSVTRHMHWDIDGKQYGEGEFCDELAEIVYIMPEYDAPFNVGKIPDWYKTYKYENSTWSCNENECYTRMLELKSGDVICPKCLVDPDGNTPAIIQRKDKLKRALKNEKN